MTAANIDTGSSDACGIASRSVTSTSFTCSGVGTHSVTLDVADIYGNHGYCLTTVNVTDSVKPTMLCKAHTAQLDSAGSVTISADDIDNGSNDACGIAATTLATAPTYSCDDIGIHTATLEAFDVNGNSDTCSETVTIEDAESPAAICQDITAQLEVGGTLTLNANDVDNGSTDNW